MINQPEQIHAEPIKEEQTANIKKRTLDAPKPSSTVKRAWHTACFQKREKTGKNRGWKRGPEWMPLQKFAKQLNDANTSAWWANKAS